MSVATVSRVFNGYDDVSDATRQRVLAVAEELDYAPSAAARTLVMQRSQLLGVVLFTGMERPDIGHPFFQEVFVGFKRGIGPTDTTCSCSRPSSRDRATAAPTRTSEGRAITEWTASC